MPQDKKPIQKLKRDAVFNKSNTVNAKESTVYKMKKSEEAAKKVIPTLKARMSRPDIPLAFTPEPMAIDNTYVAKKKY